MQGMKVFPNGLDACQKAIDLAGDNTRLLARAHKLKGQLFAATGQLQSAEEELREAIAVDPESRIPDTHYELGRVLPPNKYPIFDIPPTHPIMHSLYDVKAIEQVSSIQFWYRNGGSVSERAWMNDSPHSDFRGIQDEHGRLVVVMTHNTDIADTWEREGESREYFERFSPDGYAIGVNIILYALTH